MPLKPWLHSGSIQGTQGAVMIVDAACVVALFPGLKQFALFVGRNDQRRHFAGFAFLIQRHKDEVGGEGLPRLSF